MYNHTNATNTSLWTNSDEMKWVGFLEKVKLADKIILIIFAICATIGNILVLTVTWIEARLHQPNKYFIACLAVADLLIGILICPVIAYFEGFDNETYSNTSVHLCRFIAWTDTFVLLASIFTLTFISFDRFIKIKKPLQYKSTMTTSRSLKIIFIICLISTVIATYAATPDSGSYYWPVCERSSFDKTKKYFTFLAVSVFFLPTSAILVMYTLIFIVVRKRQKMWRNGELGQVAGVDRSQRSAFLQGLKTIRMLAFVAGVFILCWGPYFISVLLELYYPSYIDFDSTSFSYWRRIHIIMLVVDRLPTFNSLCNPIIYAWLDRTYRMAFKNLFRRIMCRPNTTIRQPAAMANELPPTRLR